MIKVKTKEKGVKTMKKVRAKNLEAVHTHTHTHTGDLNKRITLIKMKKIIEDSSYSSVIDTG